MVSVIDNQLKHLWVRVGLTPQSSVKTETWMERSSLAIVGRLPTAAEKEAFRTNKGEFRTADYVDKLLASDEFSKHWSELLAEHYLGRRVVGVRNQPVTQIAFVKWIGDSLSRGVFVGELERELISGPKSDFNDAGSWTRTDPAAYWISELLERSVVEQRESPELNSKKPIDPKNVGLVGVARHLMRISGNGPMVCSQCHESETRGDDLQGYLSKAKSNRGLDSFWAVPASLSGLSLDRSVPNVRALKIERPKQYFFEDAEGRMKLAMAGLPTPSSSKLPKQDLADWFRSSMEPRRAMVEVVWKEVFKQPLMPVFGLTSDEGNDERADLRDLLASQMQAGQKDLGKLVRWMVLSNAFRLDRHTIDSPWYLKASEGQVADVQKQMRLFASSSSTDTANIATGKIPLNQVASWMKSDHSYKQTNQALAQGATTTSSSNSGTKTNKPTYSDDQVRFLISTSKSYGILARFAEKLASSSMTWPMVVEHLYLTIDSRLPTRAEREDAEKLLNTIDQDRAKAVVMLINANCGSF